MEYVVKLCLEYLGDTKLYSNQLNCMFVCVCVVFSQIGSLSCEQKRLKRVFRRKRRRKKQNFVKCIKSMEVPSVLLVINGVYT